MRPGVRLKAIYFEKKQKAIKLRKQGGSYGEIAKILKVSKDTTYHWAKNVKLSKTAKTAIEGKMKEALRRGIVAYNKVYGKLRSQEAARIRNEWSKKAAKEIKKLSTKDLKFIGTALYWAEGNIKNRNRLQFGNSNPLMIKIVMRFFREICKIPNAKIKARVHIYPGINYRKTLNFWSQITKLPKRNFYSPQIQVSRASKGKRPRNTLPYGTLHLTVFNTELACRVKGWIQGISGNI